MPRRYCVKNGPDRKRRLEALAVTVLTALAERDALVRDAERRAGQALRTMTVEEGLSVREAADWCGSGVTVREITRLLRLDGAHQGGRNGRVGLAAGWARRSATVRWSSVEADARAGVDCLVDARFGGRGHGRACTPRDWWRIVLVGTVARSDTQSEFRGFGASV